MNIDEIKIRGRLTMVLTKPDGVTEITEKDNIIVAGGFDFICDAMGNSLRGAQMGYLAIGTGVTAPLISQTTLASELVRQTATYAHITGTQVFTMTTTFAAGVATGALTEAGIFNAGTGGVMLDRVTFAVINKGAIDVLTSTFAFTLS